MELITLTEDNMFKVIRSYKECNQDYSIDYEFGNIAPVETRPNFDPNVISIILECIELCFRCKRLNQFYIPKDYTHVELEGIKICLAEQFFESVIHSENILCRSILNAIAFYKLLDTGSEISLSYLEENTIHSIYFKRYFHYNPSKLSISDGKFIIGEKVELKDFPSFMEVYYSFKEGTTITLPIKKLPCTGEEGSIRFLVNLVPILLLLRELADIGVRITEGNLVYEQSANKVIKTILLARKSCDIIMLEPVVFNTISQYLMSRYKFTKLEDFILLRPRKNVLS